MIRHTYSSIIQKRLTCNDCEKLCKSNVLNSTCLDPTIKRVFRVDVSNFPSDDLKQLLKQITMSKCIAKTAIGMHCRDSFVDKNMHPSINECQIFIDLMNMFREHILDDYDTFKKDVKALENLLETVIVVRNNDKIVTNTKDVFLREKIRAYAKRTDNKFSTNESVFLEESKL